MECGSEMGLGTKNETNGWATFKLAIWWAGGEHAFDNFDNEASRGHKKKAIDKMMDDFLSRLEAVAEKKDIITVY